MQILFIHARRHTHRNRSLFEMRAVTFFKAREIVKIIYDQKWRDCAIFVSSFPFLCVCKFNGIFYGKREFYSAREKINS